VYSKLKFALNNTLTVILLFKNKIEPHNIILIAIWLIKADVLLITDKSWLSCNHEVIENKKIFLI